MITHRTIRLPEHYRFGPRKQGTVAVQKTLQTNRILYWDKTLVLETCETQEKEQDKPH